ncbi:MAG: hypothetical protein ABL967_19400 [Bryobacteraceae bacterium]
MPNYRIHRLKDHVRQQFRFAPHVSGAAVIKERDYEPGASIEAASPYAAFFASRDLGTALEVGDVLEAESGELRIFKYVGFEEARWFVPEPKPEEVLVQNATV